MGRELHSAVYRLKLLDDFVRFYIVLRVFADRLPHQRPFLIDHVNCCVRQFRIKVVEPFPLARDGGRHVVGEREGDADRFDGPGCGAQILRGHRDNPCVESCDLIVMILQLHELPTAGSSPPGAEEDQHDVTLAQVFA